MKKDWKFQMQIDIDITILNYAISKEWSDVNDPRPEWMWQLGFVPCGCGDYFFCLNEWTHGMGYIKKRTWTVCVQNANTRTMMKGCTNKHVNLEVGCDYCKSYRNFAKGQSKRGQWLKHMRGRQVMMLVWVVHLAMSIFVKIAGQRGKKCM